MKDVLEIREVTLFKILRVKDIKETLECIETFDKAS